MPRSRGAESERCLREEIGRIDRSILLLVDARDRAVARLLEARDRRPEADPEGPVVDLVRGWAAETGIAEPLARRVAHWLHREGLRARRDGASLARSPTTTCVLIRPGSSEEAVDRLRRPAARTASLR